MTPDELDRWLANWAAWSRDVVECYPVGVALSSAESAYRSPQRWHHGTAAPSGPEPFPVQAELVEHAVHDRTFPERWRLVTVVRWIRLPDAVLDARRVAPYRRTAKRAAEAALAVATYVDATNRARARLASILAPWRGQLP